MNKKPADAKEVLETMRTSLNKYATELNGLVDKAPASMQAGFKAIYDDVNKFLLTLNPTEQVPAAQQTGWALEMLADAMARFDRFSNGMIAQLTGIMTGNGTLTLELNGFQEKIKKGELLNKATHEAAVGVAVNAAKAALLPAIIAGRKSAMETCGLPIPADATLELPETEFSAVLTQAKTNLKSLGEKGLSLTGTGADFIKKNVFLPQAEFNGAMEIIKDLGITPKAAPAKDPANPLLGGGEDNAPKPKTVYLGV